MDMKKKNVCVRIRPHIVPKLRGFAFYSRKPISDIVEEALMLFFEMKESKGETIEPYEGKIAPGRRIKMSDE